MELGMCEASTC